MPPRPAKPEQTQHSSCGAAGRVGAGVRLPKGAARSPVPPTNSARGPAPHTHIRRPTHAHHMRTRALTHPNSTHRRRRPGKRSRTRAHAFLHTATPTHCPHPPIPFLRSTRWRSATRRHVWDARATTRHHAVISADSEHAARPLRTPYTHYPLPSTSTSHPVPRKRSVPAPAPYCRKVTRSPPIRAREIDSDACATPPDRGRRAHGVHHTGACGIKFFSTTTRPVPNPPQPSLHRRAPAPSQKWAQRQSQAPTPHDRLKQTTTRLRMTELVRSQERHQQATIHPQRPPPTQAPTPHDRLKLTTTRLRMTNRERSHQQATIHPQLPPPHPSRPPTQAPTPHDRLKLTTTKRMRPQHPNHQVTTTQAPTPHDRLKLMTTRLRMTEQVRSHQQATIHPQRPPPHPSRPPTQALTPHDRLKLTTTKRMRPDPHHQVTTTQAPTPHDRLKKLTTTGLRMTLTSAMLAVQMRVCSCSWLLVHRKTRAMEDDRERACLRQATEHPRRDPIHRRTRLAMCRVACAPCVPWMACCAGASSRSNGGCAVSRQQPLSLFQSATLPARARSPRPCDNRADARLVSTT
jgi:hypothetical protein